MAESYSILCYTILSFVLNSVINSDCFLDHGRGELEGKEERQETEITAFLTFEVVELFHPQMKSK